MVGDVVMCGFGVGTRTETVEEGKDMPRPSSVPSAVKVFERQIHSTGTAAVSAFPIPSIRSKGVWSLHSVEPCGAQRFTCGDFGQVFLKNPPCQAYLVLELW